jgi:tRNA G18 (ribose-2'-O)-methylase SpoU
MFRTSDGAGVAKLCLCGYTPRPPRKEIEKTSLGSVHTVPWEHFPDVIQAVRELKRAGVAICVLEQTTGSVPYHSIPHPRFPVCLAVGNEITGVSHSVIAEADFAIEIPMHGMKHSLNAAVAYGIGIYELVRLWKEQGVTAGDRTPG